MLTKSKHLLAGFILVSIFSLNTVASNDTTSAVRGDVGVSGATVVVTNVSTGVTKTTTADANGIFSIGNLKPGGPYKITISKSGYATESLNDVFLTVSETARLNVDLISNADIDEVVVTGSKTATVQTSLAVTAQDIENIPSNWTAEFVPSDWEVNYGDNVTSELKITPDQTVTINEKETFSVTVSWTDGINNQLNDITHTFDIEITPIEAQSPDFIVSELLWNPEVPVEGTEVTLTARITNLVNNTGIQNVPIVFYNGDEPFNVTTIVFDGNDNEEVTVTATWTATKGSHPLRVAIDPSVTLNEVDTTNNEKSITISVSSESDDDSSSFRMIALVVVGLVGGLAYISYRSKRS